MSLLETGPALVPHLTQMFVVWMSESFIWAGTFFYLARSAILSRTFNAHYYKTDNLENQNLLTTHLKWLILVPKVFYANNENIYLSASLDARIIASTRVTSKKAAISG